MSTPHVQEVAEPGLNGRPLDRFMAWEQRRLSLNQILAQARWFILWNHPSGDTTPYGFAVLEECPEAVYGYSLWARQNGRIQRIASVTDKLVLADCLDADRCELTAEAERVRQFLHDVTRQLTTVS
ncbi:hypothetical protein [Larkinella soli]|uniref:hypothetical protein n=1 Tax=Larkinella soli TaxID=1770527 RepID=UPI0013E3718C|nr:hypothetical protein [Larkinella soli]